MSARRGLSGEYGDNGGYEVPYNRRRYVEMDESMKSQKFDENNRKIVVKRLPRDISTYSLELYFESKKQLGRQLAVECADLDKNHDKAVVTFESAADVKYVLERHQNIPCKFNNQTLMIEAFTEKYDEEEDDDDYDKGSDTLDAAASTRVSQNYSDIDKYGISRNDETDTIEVRNFSEACSDDTLLFYFENTIRSGGGEIVSFSMKRDEGYARIIFKDSKVTKRVAERKHTVEDCQLTVMPFLTSKTELLLDELPDTVTKEHLTNFLEAKIKVQVNSAVFSEDRCKCLIQFAKEFDFSKAKDVCNEFKVGGVNVKPCQIPVTTGVIVTNLPEDVTHDAVEMYFENARRSHGGETRKVEMHYEDGYCLVLFKDTKVLRRVCQKKDHKINDQLVDVKPYNEYLGLPLGQEGLKIKLPEPLTLKDEDPYKMKFLKRKPSQRTILEGELAKCKAHIFWDDDPVSVECTFTKADKPKKQLLKTWSEKALECVKQFTDVLVVKKKTVDTGIWDEIRKELGGLQLTHPDDVALIMEKENKQIILVAHKRMADSVWEDILDAVATAEKKEKEKKETVTEEKMLSEWKVSYLIGADFESEMQYTYKNVKLRFEEKKGKGTIFVTGPKHTVSKVWLAMFQTLQKVREKEVDLEKEEIELLQNETTREKVKQLMKKKGVSDVWEVKTDFVVLYASDDSDLSKMETAINKTLAKVSIPLDSGTEGVLKSDKWKATEKSLRDKFSGCFVIRPHDSQLTIFTLADIQDEVSNALQSFNSKNATYKEQMSLTPQVVSFFQHVTKNKYEQEIQSLRNNGLKINIYLNEKTGAIAIEGTSDGIKEAKRVIKRLQDQIEIKQHTIRHPKVKRYVDCSQGKECLKKVESNTPCVIDMQGSGMKKCLHKSPSSVMVKFDKHTYCAEAVLQSGVKIFVVGGDITELQVDVLVNAANSEMRHAGGLAGIIANKGGRIIQNECDSRVRNKGSLSAGDVFMSGSGNLKCKFVAHAVGPHWKGGCNGEESCLQKAVLACMEKTEKRRLRSIAMPALNGGMFQYPVNMCCMAIVKAVDQHFQGSMSSIKEVYLCDISLGIVDAFTKALHVVVPNTKVQVSCPEFGSSFAMLETDVYYGDRSSEDRPQSQQSHRQHRGQFHQEEKQDTSEDSCSFVIYAESQDKVERAIKSFEKTVQKEWIIKKLEDPGIHRLNKHHIKEVKDMARNNHVDVNVDTDLGNIVVIGLVANVLEVFDAIHNQLRSADKSFYMRDQAKLMSNIVKWIYLKDQKEFPFPDRVNLEIEIAYKQKNKQVKVKDRSGGEYEIDFGNMTEHDVKQPNAKFPVIRRDLVAGAIFDIPKHWQAMEEKENLKHVTLNQQDSEYQKVLSEFQKTLGRTPTIVKIERIQNKTLYTQYAAKRKVMNVNNANKKDNERMLWHGTADYAVPSINSHGFNRSYCGINASAIGQGVYFAVNSNYSDQPTYSPRGSDGNKRMYRCLVLTGKYCNGSSDMRVPPPIDKSKPHILYDSVTNNTWNPIMFVVFNDIQAYPEHLITYK